MESFPAINPFYGLLEIPTFRTIVIDYGSGIEQRIAQSAVVQYRFRLRWTYLSDADKQALTDFFVARTGRLESFLWTHPKTAVVYTVRFAEDSANFEYVHYMLWSVQTLELLQVVE